MRKILSIVVLSLVLLISPALRAADYDAYYTNLPVEMARPALPQIPDRTASITDFGGKGDGLHLNTEAFASAISSLAKQGGGVITVPAGIWLTGPIVFQSHIELRLDRNAMILFSPDKNLYVAPSGKSSRFLPGLSADKATDIAITGEGIIDGYGAAWRPVKRNKVSDTEWKRFKEAGGVEKQDGKLFYPWQMKSGFADVESTPEKQEAKRNDLLRFTNCERILLQGVTFQNAPKFHVHPLNCTDLVFDGITVRCPWNAQNGDAIDLSDCHRALVANCVVDAGDDGICMKSGSFKEKNLVNGCEDILITDNTVFAAHGGFVIGSENICGMKRMVVRNCTFSGTDIGLRFKSGIGRGGKTEDVFISNIVMNDIKDAAISFICDHVDRPAGSDGKKMAKESAEYVPEFCDIHIYDVTCVGTKVGIEAKGVKDMNCIYDIAIDNSTIVYTKSAMDIDYQTAKIDLGSVKLVKLNADAWPVK